LERYGWTKGLNQLDELEKSFGDFQVLLKRRFSQKGLAYGRALGDVEQVKEGALKSLELVIDRLRAIESIPDNLAEDLSQYEDDSESFKFIKERIGHRKKTLQDIKESHIKVEKALTSISELSIEIANIGSDEQDKFDMYLVELRKLASQTSQFGREV
jgi:DNA repair ATPase RecN